MFDFKNGDLACPDSSLDQINLCSLLFNYFFEIIIPMRGEVGTFTFYIHVLILSILHMRCRLRSGHIIVKRNSYMYIVLLWKYLKHGNRTIFCIWFVFILNSQKRTESFYQNNEYNILLYHKSSWQKYEKNYYLLMLHCLSQGLKSLEFFVVLFFHLWNILQVCN